ncbi:MAG: succinate dehydrogenase, hydrophobic membrane anchor protein [Enterobacteriaceae bacterium]
MVNRSVSALGRNGVQEWLLLRVSAIIIVLYLFYLLGFCFTTPEITYSVWRTFFAHPLTQIATMLTLLAVLIHAWIGLWQVLTDYIKPVALRLILQMVIVIVLISYLLSGAVILWGV